MKLLKIICVLFFVFAASSLSAHPHVFINNSLEILCDDSGIKALRNVWEFDEIFSKSIIEEYDTDGNGVFSEKESRDVYENAFINIKNFNFYTHVMFGGKSISHSNIEAFKPVISGNKMIYEFTVPLSVPLKQGDHLDICVYDDSFFIAFTEPEGKVRIVNQGSRAYSFRITENDETSDYGPSFPSIIRVKPEK